MGFVEGEAFSMITILANGLLFRKGTSRESDFFYITDACQWFVTVPIFRSGVF